VLHAIRKFVPALGVLALLAGPVLVAAPALSAEVPTGAPVDGIRCDRMEGAVFHIHQHLEVQDHGKAVTVPADVGRPVAAQCLYWIHTHTSDGIIHIESPVFRTFTLGQFFDIWGQPLTPTNVAGVHVQKGQVHVFVNGDLIKSDPRKVELAQHTDIVIEAGPPYQKPQPFTDWKGQ
jgi:hypothetical protein